MGDSGSKLSQSGTFLDLTTIRILQRRHNNASQFSRWQFITAMDVIAEILLFLFSFVLARRLQMPRKIKVVIVLSFASRLPYVARRIALPAPAFLAHVLRYRRGLQPRKQQGWPGLLPEQQCDQPVAGEPRVAAAEQGQGAETRGSVSPSYCTWDRRGRDSGYVARRQ